MSLPNCMYDYRYEYDTAKVIGRCKNCGCDIHEHERRWDIFGTIICKDCIDDFSVED